MPAQAGSHSEPFARALSSVQSLLSEMQADVRRARAELAVLRASSGFAPGMRERIEAAARSLDTASRHLTDADELLAAAVEAPAVSAPVEPLERNSTLRQSHTRHFSARPEATLLTRRETEVAALMGRGLSNRQIAAELVISTATARVHVEHIMEKLGVHSRGQVALWAIRQKLVP